MGARDERDVRIGRPSSSDCTKYVRTRTYYKWIKGVRLKRFINCTQHRGPTSANTHTLSVGVFSAVVVAVHVCVWRPGVY